MRAFRERSGSALLIVLGMVAFMVVSAVGFAVFMRHNRVPSSFLRRNTAARQLAKAALACAMADIESAVRDNSYPGVGNNVEGGNRWYGRVLSPYTVSEASTVSTLTLEGLAYLPPAVVNDVRYYSRRTSTAKWKRLDYDSGRYAFCAVDVSDFFDLSRVRADVPRGSGDLGLVTPAYLFEEGNHRDWLSGMDPVDFQDAVDKMVAEKPLVSIADYNLALKKHGANSGMVSPFVEYVENNGANGFYGWTTPPSKTGEEYLKFAIQRFVVDGHSEQAREEWFENRGGNGNANPFNLQDLDISKKENQPFPELLSGDAENKNDYSAGQICDMSTPFLDSRLRQINPCEAIALYDYLDRDDIPASVAVPTVERSPMIVGVEIDADSDLKVEFAKEESGENVREEGGTRITTKAVTFYPKFSGRLDVNTGYAFPFKYRKELNQNAGDFSAEAVAYMYAIAEDETWDANDSARGCRTSIDGVMKEWPNSGNGGVGFQNGLISAASRKLATKPPTTIEDEDDAVSKTGGTFHDVQLSISGFDSTESGFKGNGYVKFFLRKREQYQNDQWVLISQGDEGWEIDPDQNSGKPEIKLTALKFVDGQMSQLAMDKTYVWGMSLAIRLYDKNQNIVDMAPAHVNDDNEQPSGDFRGWLGNLPRPVLRFDGKADGRASFTVKDGIEGYKLLKEKALAAAGGEAIGFLPKTYLTDDPRYNYAAENWYPADAAAGSLGEAWLNQVSCGGDTKQDSDIFMSVSNQGYLQDPGELAFIPRVCGFNPGSLTEMKPLTESATGKIPAGRDAAANNGLMWRTYGCCGRLGDDEVDNLRLISPVMGFRANPYSSDEMIRLAPFLNTPYDWWAAGTNRTDSVKKKMIDANGRTRSPEESVKYSFSERGVEAKVEYKYMEELANKISSVIRTGDSGMWYRRWKEMDWLGGSDTSICGVDLNRKLHDVDRKFLCAYWRKCYANAQQLYIVFFRAEPVVLGGGMGDGNTPAQLGARGVAVVWREPTLPEGAPADAPHRMRVLFYRQFD